MSFHDFASAPDGFGPVAAAPAECPTVAIRPQPPRAGPEGTLPSGGGYAAGRPRWSVFVAIVALHFAAITVLALARYQVETRVVPPHVTTFAITLPPPPPQELPAEKPESAVSEAARPAPVIVPAPQIALPAKVTLPDVALAPVRAEPVKIAVTNSPAPVAASIPTPPPAPVVPPDFKAAQLNNAGPAYPYLARKAHQQGVVMLRVLVNTEGRAKRVEIEGSSGHERLDEAALKTVRKWRFLPARQRDLPVEAWVLVPVTFSLG